MRKNNLTIPLKGSDNINLFKNENLNKFYKILKNDIILNSVFSFSDIYDEIKEIFDNDMVLIKNFLKIVSSIKNDLKINFSYFLDISGIKYYLYYKYNSFVINDILEIIEKNPINIKIKNNIYILNDFEISIILDNSIGNKLGTNKNNKIFINKRKHDEYGINIYETVLHELMHLYFKNTGITKKLLDNKIQYIEELLCEFFIFCAINSI